MLLTTRLILIALLLLAPAPLGAQTRDRLPSVDLPAGLARVLRDYETAWRARDADRLAALFHEHGFVLSPGQPPVHGRDAIRRRYDGAGGPLFLRALAYAADDTVGYIIGTFGGRADQDAGKFVLALRRARRDQPWLIAADMDNPNQRPGGTQ